MNQHLTTFMILILCLGTIWPTQAQTPPTSTQLTPNLFSVTTDKAKYTKGEEIKITVTNLSKTRVRVDSYANPRCPIQQLVNNQWQTVPSVTCSCSDDVQCNMSESYIDPGQMDHFNWSQMTSWCDGHNGESAPAKPGTYRVMCPLNEISSSVNRVEVVSMNFEIGG